MKKALTPQPRLMKQANPALVSQWHPTKNPDYDVHQVTKGMNVKVWWQCELGHEWQANINQRVRGSKCPFCSGHRIWVGFNDLATTHPQIAAQWHPTKNGALTPQDVSKGSPKKVWWQCGLGHEWQADVKQRTGGDRTNCPTCQGRRNLKLLVGFNDLATTHPTLAAQWHPNKNHPLTPQQVTYGMGRKVWWQCACGCEWEARILARHQGSGCPDCGSKRRRGPRKTKFVTKSSI